MKPAGPLPSRNQGIDVARGLAVLLMIETHAYDGWVSPAGKETHAYHLTRLLSNIPAALFLLLAGVGLATGAARRAQVDRPALARRALQVVGYGYVVSLAYAAIEGSFHVAEVLRADILHCIGLSLLLCTYVLIGRSRLVLRAALLAVAAVGLALLLPRLAPPLPGPLRVAAALVYDVAPYTRFPLLPLCAFCAIGVGVGAWLAAIGAADRPGAPAATPRAWLLRAAVAAGLAVLFTWATVQAVALLGGKLSRAHPAVIFNVMNGACRALCVLSLSLAWAGAAARGPGADSPLRAALRAPLPSLARLGRGSLLAYAAHIPLCYGRLSAPLAGRLGMAAATAAVIALMGLTYGVVRLRDHQRDRRAS